NVTASTNTVLQIVYAQVRKPRFNAGWSQAEALDIEWAHAMAPGAKIVLVEAASNSNSNLYAADDLAATIAGAHQCSNSWSGGESSGELSSDSHFNHASMTYFFSSGDTGGARGYPAASPNVVAVGGTPTRASPFAGTGAGTCLAAPVCPARSSRASSTAPAPTVADPRLRTR
ncbi:MAG: peptidase S8/S53 subtilisin kexin sedolisin, partial [Fimbriimonas ginsengisoli]|nr:peptidase S8/S53 subtilisin kexin sedolisin [Fimbriimonas ginsengisoli]